MYIDNIDPVYRCLCILRSAEIQGIKSEKHKLKNF